MIYISISNKNKLNDDETAGSFSGTMMKAEGWNIGETLSKCSVLQNKKLVLLAKNQRVP